MTTARFISPFMTNGNIEEYLDSSPDPVSDDLRLKLGNVLITDNAGAILCDFGLARLADGQSSGLTTTKTIKGSIRYMSPELFDEDPVHTLSSDVWAYGCLVLKVGCFLNGGIMAFIDQIQVMTGTSPYGGARSDNQTLLALALKQPPAELTNLDLQHEKLKTLLGKCWEIDPSARPTSSECQLYLPETETKESQLSETSAQVHDSDHHKHSMSSNDDEITIIAPRDDQLSQPDSRRSPPQPLQPITRLPDVLLASLSPSTLSHAEKSLSTLSTTQPEFLHSLLQLVLDQSQQIQARQAAAVYFKNVIKRRWDAEAREEIPIDQNEKNTLREKLIPTMVALSSQSKLLRTQIADAVGLVAAVDFPRLWPGLLTQLVSYLSPANYAVNVCILEIAHSIFARWRSQTRSDELFRAINYTLENFQDPFFSVFDATAMALLSGQTLSDLDAVAQAQALLMQIYLDLTFQDIPPEFEDSIGHFFGAEDGDEGYFIMFLRWDPPALRGDEEDPAPTGPMDIKTAILEICELFELMYSELIGDRVPTLLRAVWELIGASSLAVREDAMVAQAIKFLSTTAKTGLHKALFADEGTLQGLAQRIIVPSMPLRDHEVEQFEEDPLEYIRRDLSLSTEGGGSRRHTASELIRALFSIGLDAPLTHLIGRYIDAELQEYSANPSENWRSKDTAIYLFTAIATQASTSHHGVTMTNGLVDIVKFFSENVAQDLQIEGHPAHPILQVDAIRFIYTFRHQLTKEQLASALPVLAHHLGSSNYVCYTYAAITIERILFMKSGKTPMFGYTDIQGLTDNILNTLFKRILIGDTPDKVAENEYLMKCVMRVITTASSSLAATYQNTLLRLVEILSIVCENPSNPQFNQYTFESISALLRYVTLADVSSLTHFEVALSGTISTIFQQDVTEFIPYVFQILAQMLEIHPNPVPGSYRSLLGALMAPASWAHRGNVPALVRLVNAFLVKDGPRMEAEGHVKTVVAIVQSRFMPSKLNDTYGFELLQTIVRVISPQLLKDVYFPVMLNSVFSRLQTLKTDKFTYSVSYWILYTMALPIDGLGPDTVIEAVESVQTGIWSALFGNVVLPEVSKTRPLDRKTVAVGLTRLLTESRVMLSNALLWQPAFLALEQLVTKADAVAQGQVDESETMTSAMDHEDAPTCYQTSFCKLTASQPKRYDPADYVLNMPAYVKQTLSKAVDVDLRARALVALSSGSPWSRALQSGEAF
ncbi:importin-alpha export receptor [Tulasnella sp. 417]|nr:importin-alpha export receptor [Tulasnella sp. 417]